MKSGGSDTCGGDGWGHATHDSKKIKLFIRWWRTYIQHPLVLNRKTQMAVSHTLHFPSFKETQNKNISWKKPVIISDLKRQLLNKSSAFRPGSERKVLLLQKNLKYIYILKKSSRRNVSKCQMVFKSQREKKTSKWRSADDESRKETFLKTFTLMMWR